MPLPINIMKKYICILAGAALLAACEQKTETTEPAASETTSPASTTAETTSPASTTESSTDTSTSTGGTAESPAEASPTP
jgi:PBP1b-binding outer membrane lipoprotein LpoB